MYQDLTKDYRRFKAELGGKGYLVFISHGFLALSFYRVERGIRTSRWRIIQALAPLTVPIRRIVESLTQISLPGTAIIGPGLYIPHFGPIVISDRAVVGADCTISHGVTVGRAGRGDRPQAPSLGNRVYVGAGAMILGHIIIEDDVAIGAASLVLQSLPKNAVAVGNPARIISYKGSAGLQQGVAHE